ncbi:MAG: hypothetical protein JWQ94_3735 [Tardiphaga sp.]|nr:hypothetical protein [Tardiphaga sp.]
MKNKSNWKIGDWAIFDLEIVQIKEIRDNGNAEVSTGMISTSGDILPRLRELTLRNKVTAESLEYQYRALRGIKGERGFNYPDINRYFCELSLMAIDGDEKDSTFFDKATEFVHLARDYTPVIHGVELFRA